MTRDDLLKQMNDGFQNFMAYLDTLTEADFITNRDAAGWTVKDHVMHLAVWEDDIWALLEGLSRHEHMGIDQVTWASNDYDHSNAVIQQKHRNKPLGDVLQTFRDVHQRLVATIESMNDDDLQHSYNAYQPGAGRDVPVIGSIISNTYEHYAEHQPWIAAIVSG